MVLDGHGAALCSGCPGCILPSWQCRSSRCSWRGSVYLLRVVLTQSVAVKALFASSQVTAAKPVNHPSPAIKFSPVCGIRAAPSQSEQALSHRIAVPDLRTAFILTQQLLLLLERSS